FAKMLASRTPSNDGSGKPGPNDRPFRSLATGLTPSASDEEVALSSAGLEDTFLRSDLSNKLLFELNPVDQDHPYIRMELLNKIFNNIPPRSNVFAVWLTVGFFEVTDDSTRPVKLGRELGRAENRHIRHRMFGIVDRSVLTSNPGPQPRFDPRAERSPGVEAPTGRVVPYFSIIE